MDKKIIYAFLLLPSIAFGSIVNSIIASKHMALNQSYDSIVEVEWLRSDGNQYVDTGIIGSSKTYVKIVASSDNTKYNSCLFGARSISGSSWNNMFVIWQRVSYADRSRFDYGTRTLNLNNIWPASDIVTIEKNGILNLVNGQNVGNNRVETFTCEYAFYIFGCNTGGNADAAGFIGQIYSCIIIEDDEVARYFIPVRVGATGYMYDQISGKLFGNQGTGSFSIGPDK